MLSLLFRYTPSTWSGTLVFMKQDVVRSRPPSFPVLTEFTTGLLRAFAGDRFVFGYSACFGDELTARLLDLSDAVLEHIGEAKSNRRKVAFLLVEAYQNIIRHRADLPAHIDRGEGRSFFCFRANPAGQDLVAINGVRKRAVEDIVRQLDAVRGLDHAELKNISMRMLQAPSESRGAGVGFIEMTRRSGNDLGHMLRGLGPVHDLFALGVRSGETYPYEKILREAAALHGNVVMSDILLYHAGHQPPAVVDTIADMVHHDVDPTCMHGRPKRCAEAYRFWAERFSSVDPGNRTACVVANGGNKLLLKQVMEVPADRAGEAWHELDKAADQLPLNSPDERPAVRLEQVGSTAQLHVTTLV